MVAVSELGACAGHRLFLNWVAIGRASNLKDQMPHKIGAISHDRYGIGTVKLLRVIWSLREDPACEVSAPKSAMSFLEPGTASTEYLDPLPAPPNYLKLRQPPSNETIAKALNRGTFGGVGRYWYRSQI